MTITCFVESQPYAQVTWLKDGKIITDKTKNILLNRNGSRNILYLVALDESDFGNYTCAAGNRLGVSEDSVRIAGK